MVVAEYGQRSKAGLLLTDDDCFFYSIRYDLTPQLGNGFVVLFGLEAHEKSYLTLPQKNSRGKFHAPRAFDL